MCREGNSTWACAGVLGVPHIVARFDNNRELGEDEVVNDVRGGLELAAGGTV